MTEYIVKSIKINDKEIMDVPEICVGNSLADATKNIVMQKAYKLELVNKNPTFRVIIGQGSQWSTLDILFRKSDYNPPKEVAPAIIEKVKIGRPRLKP